MDIFPELSVARESRAVLEESQGDGPGMEVVVVVDKGAVAILPMAGGPGVAVGLERGRLGCAFGRGEEHLATVLVLPDGRLVVMPDYGDAACAVVGEIGIAIVPRDEAEALIKEGKDPENALVLGEG